MLLRGANKEHRNVSDYTPLSLAASGGYVNIIKILLNAGAEINSRLAKNNVSVTQNREDIHLYHTIIFICIIIRRFALSS